MNPAQLHLIVNHLPVIGTVIGSGLLAFALWRKSADVTKAALGLFVLLAVTGGAVHLTGQPAERIAERLDWGSEAILYRHETAALVSTVLLGAYGIFSLGLLLIFRRTAAIPSRTAAIALALALVPTAAMGYTANLGGQIRHGEFDANNPPAGTVEGDEEVLQPAGLPPHGAEI